MHRTCIPRMSAGSTDQASPGLSVLLSVYNGEKYLREALDTLLAQTFGDFELVAVDDASTDATPAILSEYADEDPRIRIITNAKNLGLVNALNVGLAECRAPLVARADADDIYHPERLAKQVAFMEQHEDVGVLSCWFRRVSEDGTMRRVARPPTEDHFIRIRQLFMSSILHPGVMFRADVVRSVGGYDADYRDVEDSDLWARLRPHTRFAVLPKILVDYRVHSSSIMQTRDEAARRRSISVNQRLISEYLGRDVDFEQAAAAVSLFQGFTMVDAEKVPAGLELLSEVVDRARRIEEESTVHYLMTELAAALEKQAHRYRRKNPRLMASLLWHAMRMSPAPLSRGALGIGARLLVGRA